MKEKLVLPDTEEKTLLDLLANGQKAHHICNKVKLSPETLAVKLRALRVRYKAENTTQLVAIAVRNGWIE